MHNNCIYSRFNNTYRALLSVVTRNFYVCLLRSHTFIVSKEISFRTKRARDNNKNKNAKLLKIARVHTRIKIITRQ